jgi:hypothetical protein
VLALLGCADYAIMQSFKVSPLNYYFYRGSLIA